MRTFNNNYSGLRSGPILREAGAGGSNPLTPTNNFRYLAIVVPALIQGRSGFDPDFAVLWRRFPESLGPRNRKAADRAGTRVNGQIEKFAEVGYQIAPVIAIAGGADV